MKGLYSSALHSSRRISGDCTSVANVLPSYARLSTACVIVDFRCAALAERLKQSAYRTRRWIRQNRTTYRRHSCFCCPPGGAALATLRFSHCAHHLFGVWRPLVHIMVQTNHSAIYDYRSSGEFAIDTLNAHIERLCSHSCQGHAWETPFCSALPV